VQLAVALAFAASKPPTFIMSAELALRRRLMAMLARFIISVCWSALRNYGMLALSPKEEGQRGSCWLTFPINVGLSLFQIATSFRDGN
jgi:hypothetical protein